METTLKKTIAVLIVVTSVALTSALGSSPATAADGPRLYVSAKFSDGSKARGSAKYLGGNDVFQVCIGGNGLINARVVWRTSSLSGRHTRSIYQGKGCSTFDHAFKKGTVVRYRLCGRTNAAWKCTRWVSGTSTY